MLATVINQTINNKFLLMYKLVSVVIAHLAGNTYDRSIQRYRPLTVLAKLMNDRTYLSGKTRMTV